MVALTRHGGNAYGKHSASTDITFEPIDYSGLKIAAYVSTGASVDASGKDITVVSPTLQVSASFLGLLSEEHDLKPSHARATAARYLTALHRYIDEKSQPYGGLNVAGDVTFTTKDPRNVLPGPAELPTVAQLGAVSFSHLDNPRLKSNTDNERMALLANLFEEAHQATVAELGATIANPARAVRSSRGRG